MQASPAPLQSVAAVLAGAFDGPTELRPEERVEGAGDVAGLALPCPVRDVP
ncbi:MAG: hypothetical protein HY905_20235 [Deltaproteobacteria bacterium]|nr:hypothetical protein [Deltaproteobacteria bacterium]